MRNSKLMAHQRIRRLELELHRLRRLTAGLTPPAVSRVLAQRIARMESEAEQAESQRKSLEARLNELQLATPALQPTIVQLGLAVEPLPPTRGPSESSGVERLGMLRSIKDAETASSRPSATTLAVPRRADDTATSSDSLGTGMVATRLRRMSAAPPTVIVPLRLAPSYISPSLGTVFFEPSRQRISRSTTAAEPAEKDSAVAAELAVGKAAAEKAAAEAAVAEAVTAEACAAEEAVEAVEAAAEEAAAEEAAVDNVGAGQVPRDSWSDADGWGEVPSLKSLPRGGAAEGPQAVAEDVSVAAAPSPSDAATALPPAAVAAATVPPPASSCRQSAPLVQMVDGQWQLCPEGTSLLSSVRTPLVVVACAGLYRTGKSFFLNALAGHLGDKASRGFRVGSTSESCTRGIDVCIVHEPPAPASAEAAGGAAATGGFRRTLVLLDSEGIASMDQDETYDSQIFSLALLLSSYFVLNSMGVIDEAAIDRLFLITEISKRVCAATGPAGAPGATTAADAAATAEEEEAGASSRKELSRFFPPLLWLLRDFVLELRDDKGAPLSPDQYMERALESRAVGQRRADERNETRAAIRELSPRHRGGGGKARHDRMLMASNCLPLQVSSSRAARV